MKILLTGSSGQLGKSIIETKPSGIKLITPDRKTLDLSNPDSCESIIYKYTPDLVINAGAFTDVDQAEKEKKTALAVNAIAPEYLSKALLKTGGKLIQISTDFVFNGNQGSPYMPYQSLSPINTYGFTKAKGESAIEKVLGNRHQALILRTSWIMGAKGNNFALKILDLLNKKSNLRIISDQIGCPTSTTSLSNACWKIVLKKDKVFSVNQAPIPIYHFSDAGAASWYDVAIAIMEISKDLGIIEETREIKPIRTEDYITPAKRPNFSLLNCFSTREILNIKAINWRQALLYELDKIKKFNCK